MDIHPTHSITSGQARKGLRRGHPELSVECPQCHSAVGRKCFMKPGFLGITHIARRVKYQSGDGRATLREYCARESQPAQV
jgi:hypothetical protein